MNILVYGVHHWGDNPLPKKELAHLKEWKERIYHYIPGAQIFIATGNYSDPQKSPHPANVKIVQNDLPFLDKYSIQVNYFRNGLTTGIWHALLNEKQWDILLHIQPRVLLGTSMLSYLETFLKNDTYQVIAPCHHCSYGTEIEISFFGMKRAAAQKLVTAGLRQSIEQKNTVSTISCEQEALLLFKDQWYNPWPEVLTTRQLDFYSMLKHIEPTCSLFTELDLETFKKLPLVSCGKHALVEYIQEWREHHPYNEHV